MSLDVALVSVGYHLSIHVPSPEFSAADITVASELSVVKTTGFDGLGLVADVFEERAYPPEKVIVEPLRLSFVPSLKAVAFAITFHPAPVPLISVT